MRPALIGGPDPSDDRLDGCLLALCLAALAMIGALAVMAR